jgi:uncharacterized membrane protein
MMTSVILPNLIVLFLIPLIVAAVVIALVRSAGHRHAPPPQWSLPEPPNPAIGELDLRYARGEVEREEYLRRRADLLGQYPPPQSG